MNSTPAEEEISVFNILDWPIKRDHYLPNFFTSATIRTEERYYNGDMIFLHHNKAGGSTMKFILKSIAQTSSLRHILITKSNADVVQQMTDKGRNNNSQQTIYYGDHAFGSCDFLPPNRSCSYFTMIRNPYSRIISAYFYCQKAHDELCGNVDTNTISIETWAQLQGSYFFRQLLNHPAMCSDAFEGYAKDFQDRTSSVFHHRFGNIGSCKFREQSYLQQRLTILERRKLLDYCLSNLENLFAVIGLLEELDLSLAMFQTVYHQPFVASAGVKCNSERSSRNNSVSEEMMERLKTSEAASEALYEDLMIYEKMLEIFEEQRIALDKLGVFEIIMPTDDPNVNGNSSGQSQEYVDKMMEKHACKSDP